MRSAWLIPLVAFTGLACGYHWARTTDGLGEGRRVSLQTLRNDSYEPGVERLVTDALVQELLRRGVHLVNDPRRAELVLSGVVKPLETRQASLSSSFFVLEYEVFLRLELEARRADGSEVDAGRLAVEASELYLASPDVEVTRRNREEALRRLAGVLAARVHQSLARSLGP